MDTADAVVIGAGLAGLAAAVRLAEAGRSVVVLEAGDEVGGRERTDLVDGFRLDRGFHVFTPTYPAVRRFFDVDALQLNPFPVAVTVHRGRTLATVAHPLRHPLLLPATWRSGLLHPRELVALARWAAPAILGPRTVIGGEDRTLRDGWDRAGVHGALRTEVLEPFLAGVIADDRAETSDTYVRLLVRMFAFGRPGLPAAGIRAAPAQLAARARAAGALLRLGSRVTRLSPFGAATRVETEGGDAISARSVVVAVAAEDLPSLTSLPRPATRGLQTWWFSPDDAPADTGMLRVDGTRSGPVVNTSVLSRVVPSYAPAGRHLVHASCLLPAGTPANEPEVRRHLSVLWRADATRWPLLRRDDLPDALPALPPPMQPGRPFHLDDRVVVAGDHRRTPSIQGALVSGERAARAVLAAG
jgi:phytoene dehydrogenase-like protein